MALIPMDIKEKW